MFGSLCSVAEIAITLRIDAFHVNPVNVGTRRIQGFQDSTTEFGHSFAHFVPPPCASLVSPPSLGLSFMSRTPTSQLTCSENSDSIRQDIPRSDGGGQVSSIKYLITSLIIPAAPIVPVVYGLSIAAHPTNTARLCTGFITRLIACPEYPPTSSGSNTKLPYFIACALHRTKLHSSVTSAALVLLQYLKARFPTARGSSGHRLFLSAFMIASKVMCDDTYSNKSWLIVGQGMFQLREISKMEREICQCLDWELNVEPGTLKGFEDMVHKDFAGPGPYPTYVLQTISKLAATATDPFLAVAPNNSTSPLVPDMTHRRNPPLHPQSHHHQNPAPPPRCRWQVRHSWSPSIVGHPTGFLAHSNIIL